MRDSGSKASSDSQDANQVCAVGYLGVEVGYVLFQSLIPATWFRIRGSVSGTTVLISKCYEF